MKPLLCVLFGVVVCASKVEAALLFSVESTIVLDAGIHKYEYEVINPLSNLLDGDPDLFLDFAVQVAPTADLFDVATPTGWAPTYTSGDPQIQWTAGGFSDVLSPGASLSFAFSSALAPVDQEFQLIALNSSGFELGFGAARGPGRLGPSVVPEPSSVATWVLVGLSAGSCALRRRKRRAEAAESSNGIRELACRVPERECRVKLVDNSQV